MARNTDEERRLEYLDKIPLRAHVPKSLNDALDKSDGQIRIYETEGGRDALIRGEREHQREITQQYLLRAAIVPIIEKTQTEGNLRERILATLSESKRFWQSAAVALIYLRGMTSELSDQDVEVRDIWDTIVSPKKGSKTAKYTAGHGFQERGELILQHIVPHIHIIKDRERIQKVLTS